MRVSIVGITTKLVHTEAGRLRDFAKRNAGTDARWREGDELSCRLPQAFHVAAKADAEKFQARFGGEIIDPKDMPRWPGRGGRR